MRSSYCVQHHPARVDLLAGLGARLGEYELVTDPDPDGRPSPLRTYIECLRRTPPDATHRVVVQDDARPCTGFRVLAEEALAERPEGIVAFFVSGLKSGGSRRVLQALSLRARWVDIGGASITPLVATAWPQHLIEPFIEFATSSRIQSRYSHDDPVATLFVKKHKLSVWATVPSLVEHPDEVPSLIGKSHSAGRNRNRVAAHYAGDF